MPRPGPAEGAVAARHGFKAIRIACLPAPTFAPEYHRSTDTPDRLDPEAPERAFEFCSQLIERIDDQTRCLRKRHRLSRGVRPLASAGCDRA
jgi:hypothetical protein